MEKPLLSVIIATKNREEYCIAAIHSILKLNNDKIHIAISDNSATTKVKDFVSNLNHPLIDYVYDSEGMTMVENYNRATNLAKGEFVIMIGDDDTILPNCIEIAQLMKEKGIHAVSGNVFVEYFWPSTQVSGKGVLIIRQFTKELKKFENRANIVALMRGGILDYHRFNLPKLYHGIIRKAKLDAIKEKVGKFYDGLSPDIYSAVTLGLIMEHSYIYDYPFSIAGVCKGSGSFSADNKPLCGPIENMPYLKFRPIPYKWNEIVPKFDCPENVWANSALDALTDFKEDNLKQEFNYYEYYKRLNNIYTEILPDIFPKVLDETRAFLSIDKETFYTQITTEKKVSKIDQLRSLKNRVLRKVKYQFATPFKRVDNVNDIEEATKIVVNTLDLSYLPPFK